MYRLSAFYFARSASDLPMEFTLPSIFIFIAYFMGGLRRDAGPPILAEVQGVMLLFYTCFKKLSLLPG